MQEVRKLWQEQYSTRDVPRPASSSSFEQSIEPDEFDIIERELNVVQLKASKRDDIDSFITAEPVHIEKTALEWWLEEAQRRTYPRLSQMAIDILSIPAMSAEAERVFSGARRQISWSRARLGAGTIEHMECLKHWMKNKVLKNYQYSMDDDLVGIDVGRGDSEVSIGC